jgi:hypothetical protein
MPVKFSPCAGAFEELAVVFPARLADPDLRGRRDPAQEVGRDLERAGATQALHGHRPTLLDHR